MAAVTLFFESYARFSVSSGQRFPGNDISVAIYLTYSSDREVSGFQLNDSKNGMMLDGLAGM